MSRTAPLLIATIASALLVAGPAYAADPPPAPNTPECAALVEKDPKVVAANQGSAGGLAAAKAEAEGRLCTAKSTSPTTKPTSSSSTPPTSSSSVPRPENSGSANRQAGVPAGPPPKNRFGRAAGDRDCADFATQPQAQAYFESIGGSPSNNADRLDENHNGVACESLDDDGDNQDAAVTTTGDDESKAETSGDQVTEVPEGSAQTGGNQ